jgi:hypothetical protein
LLPKSTASKSSENKINTVSKVLIPGMSLALLSVILCKICGNRSDGTPEDLGKPIIPAVKPVAASEPVPNLETFKKTKVFNHNCLKDGKKITDKSLLDTLESYAGCAFVEINKALRENKGKFPMNFSCDNGKKGVVTYEELNSLIMNEECRSEFTEDCIVYRGMSFDEKDNFCVEDDSFVGMVHWAKDNGIKISKSMNAEEIRNKMIDRILIEWGFCSTTHNEDVAFSFALGHKSPPDMSVKFKILAQKGAKFLDINYQKNIPRGESESEILFLPGAKFRILDVEKDEKYNLLIISAVMLLPNQS